MGDDLYSGSIFGASAVGVPSFYDPSMMLPGDSSDAQQMQVYDQTSGQTGGSGQPPWWAGVIAHGITRVIDNQFPTSPTGVYGNIYPGSAAGMNGQTYTIRPNGIGGGVMQGGPRAGASVSLGGNPLLLIGLVGAFLLLK